MSKSFRSKRGISSIIATLILILLTIVLIGIVWVVINNLVSNSTKQIPSGEECLSSGFQTVSFVCTQSGSDCNVTVKRISGSDAIGGMRLVFTNDNQDSNTSDSAGDILTFASKVIQVTNIGVANVTQVGSAAYFLDSSGAITPCSVLSEAVGSVNSVTGLTGTSGGGSSNGTSGGGSSGSNNTLCVPEGTTLASLCGNYQCGDLDNGTCGMVTCGSCNSQQYCDFSSHTCKDYGASCTPATNPDFSALCGNYQCGEVNNGTCPYVTCGTCGSGQYCNLVTNTCDNVSTCVQAPLDFCQAHSYQCGQFSNGTCGGSILCGSGTQSDGCNFPAVCNVTNYQCQSPIDLNSGKITSVWFMFCGRAPAAARAAMYVPLVLAAHRATTREPTTRSDGQCRCRLHFQELIVRDGHAVQQIDLGLRRLPSHQVAAADDDGQGQQARGHPRAGRHRPVQIVQLGVGPSETHPLCGGLQGGSAWDSQGKRDAPVGTIRRPSRRRHASRQCGEPSPVARPKCRARRRPTVRRDRVGLHRKGRPRVGDLELDGVGSGDRSGQQRAAARHRGQRVLHQVLHRPTQQRPIGRDDQRRGDVESRFDGLVLALRRQRLGNFVDEFA